MNKGQPSKTPTTMQAAAGSIVEHLQSAGHIALFAGGCVRDMLMGSEPNDYDVATSADPKEVSRLFKRTRQVGAKFGVVLVRIGTYAIEVATFRRDLDYKDGRRPGAVEFTDAREDALRRDFTVNGMFYDPTKREVVDYVGGHNDLKDKLIRAIGDPERRFAEDHLRILRAVRFAARFDFKIEPATWIAMKDHAAEIAKISPERIREELEAILAHPRRSKGFDDLCESGVFGHLWPTAPGVLPHRVHIERHLAALPQNAAFELALAVVLAPLPHEVVAEACDSIRCSNQSKNHVCWLYEKQAALHNPSKLNLADLKLLMAHPAFDDLLAFTEAQLKATDAELTPYREVVSRIRLIKSDDVAPPPLLTGHDLESLGLAKGPAYRTILDCVNYLQLDEQICDKAAALDLAQKLIRENSK